MYIFGHISVKQRLLPDQQLDFVTCVVQLCKNNSGLKGLAQAKIIKKSVILFWLLNMTI